MGAGLALLTAACALPGVHLDFTSVSYGQSNDGRMMRPRRMDNFGEGFRSPRAWRDRGNRYGIDELVDAVQGAAERVQARHGRSWLGVADLSPRKGGATPWHRSHHSGRDVDLIFYSVDGRGRVQRPPELEMIRYDARGRAFKDDKDEPPAQAPGEMAWSERRFDTKRNWALVEALLEDPEIRVQWIFVSDGIRARLLEYARKHDAPTWLIAYAEEVMYQPGPRAPHDDHFHVRIYCPREDRIRGCVDTGPVWHHEKKTYKYPGPETYAPRWKEMPPPPLFLVPR